ncbi:MAG: bifunctional pyr operon transcriptional regulator/uracil phosphoribosyltransferase PyrR [Arenicellales bacterium WSBS_2016_MAG_OTU3]
MTTNKLPQVDTLLNNMAHDLSDYTTSDSIVIGVHTGGVWLAQRLHKALNVSTELGTLDISFYRDDFTRIGLHPQVKGSAIAESIEDRNIILVDDVLHTGRTVRAALNEIFSFGRPAKVILAVLIDRGQRELPVRADVIGCEISLPLNQHIKLSGPDVLKLVLSEKA